MMQPETSTPEKQPISVHNIGSSVVANYFHRDHGNLKDSYEENPNFHNTLMSNNRQLSRLALQGVSKEDAFINLFGFNPTRYKDNKLEYGSALHASLANLGVFAFTDHPFLAQFPEDTVKKQFVDLITLTIGLEEEKLAEEQNMSPIRIYELQRSVTHFKELLSKVKGENSEVVLPPEEPTEVPQMSSEPPQAETQSPKSMTLAQRLRHLLKRS